MKKYKPYIIALIITLAAEILVFNFSSVKSLFYKSVDLTDMFSVSHDEYGALELTAETRNMDIKNLYIDYEKALPEDTLNISIYLADEGNYYIYYAGGAYINAECDKYINIHPYGKVDVIQIRVLPGTADIKGIEANAKRPLFFNIWRVLVIYLLFIFFYTLREKGTLIKIPCDFKRKQNIITITLVIITIVVSLLLTSSHRLFDESTKPHHQQYKELAHALKEGRVYLSYEPSEGLKNAENPYDTVYLQANGIDYRADYAYYEGKYYVYFGIVPEILIYYPYYLITGKDFPNHAAVFLFFAGFSAGVFLLYAKLIKRLFKRVSFAVYLILSTATVLSPTFSYIMFTADLYSVPIMAGLCFTVWGLALWLTGLGRLNEKKEINAGHKAVLYLALGSLCMALVAGCRPQMLLFSLLFIPIFWKSIFKEHTLFNKNTIPEILALIIPYVLIAIGIMYYNYARFGSVFDFGATYSLTNNDMNNRGTSLARMLLGLLTFLFSPPTIKGEFPFIYSTSLSGGDTFGYVGKIVTEYLLGGVFIANVLTWALALLPRLKKALKDIGLWTFCITALLCSLIIGMADANQAGILQRYSADMAFGILLTTSVILFLLSEYFVVEYGNVELFSRVFNPLGVVTGFIKVGFVLQLFYSLLVICNTASGITLKEYNPQLFYGIRALFKF